MSQFNDQLTVGLLGQYYWLDYFTGITEVKVQISAERGGMVKYLELWTCPY